MRRPPRCGAAELQIKTISGQKGQSMDFTSIFDGKALTLEEFQAKTKDMKLADLATGDYVAKGKDQDQKAEISRLKKQLAEKDSAIAALEAVKGDASALQAELDKYKQAEADRRKAEKEAETDRILTAAAEQAIAGREFINDYTRAHFIGELKKAIVDPANKGKVAAELFEDMTKDVDGIFRNQQLEPLKIAGVGKKGGKVMSREEILKIRDASERQAAMAANIELFRRDE